MSAKLTDKERKARRKERMRKYREVNYNGTNIAGVMVGAYRQRCMDAKLATAVRACDIKRMALDRGLCVGAKVRIERLWGTDDFRVSSLKKATVISLDRYVFRVRHEGGYTEAFPYVECALHNATGSRIMVIGGKRGCRKKEEKERKR